MLGKERAELFLKFVSMRLILDARTAAFAALVDSAALLSPTPLSMEDAVLAYRRGLAGSRAWMSGRFLCRASQLSELAAVATTSFVAGDQPWEIGVIFDLSPGESAALASDFRAEMDPVMTVAATEACLDDPTTQGIHRLFDALLSPAPAVVPFVEVDHSGTLGGQIALIADALSSRNRVGGAQIRIGGPSVSSLPTSGEVAEFIMAATARKLPFKLAGSLHRPIRHFDESINDDRHGLVNLVVASALAGTGESRETVEAVVAETDPEAFSLSVAFARWRSYEVTGAALRRMRQSGLISSASHSLEEPVEALAGLSFLGEGA